MSSTKVRNTGTDHSQTGQVRARRAGGTQRTKAKGTTRSAATSRRNRPTPRQRLLDSAIQLFTTEGIRVIGIDRILREADVAKASLYSLYGSKDALVIAYLQALDADWRDAYAQRCEGLTTPEAKILAFFDQSIAEEPQKQFRGSHFHNAVTEYPRPETESEYGIIQAAVDHREWKLATLTELLTEKNGYPSRAQANQLLLLLDGGLAGGQVTRSVEPLKLARELAVQLLTAPPADYSI